MAVNEDVCLFHFETLDYWCDKSDAALLHFVCKHPCESVNLSMEKLKKVEEIINFNMDADSDGLCMTGIEGLAFTLPYKDFDCKKFPVKQSVLEAYNGTLEYESGIEKIYPELD